MGWRSTCWSLIAINKVRGGGFQDGVWKQGGLSVVILVVASGGISVRRRIGRTAVGGVWRWIRRSRLLLAAGIVVLGLVVLLLGLFVGGRKHPGSVFNGSLACFGSLSCSEAGKEEAEEDHSKKQKNKEQPSGPEPVQALITTVTAKGVEATDCLSFSELHD